MKNPRIEGLRKNLRALEEEESRLHRRLQSVRDQIDAFHVALLSLLDENPTREKLKLYSESLPVRNVGSHELEELKRKGARVLSLHSRISKDDWLLSNSEQENKPKQS